MSDRFRLSGRAATDLLDLNDFVADVTGSETAAAAVVNAFYDRLDRVVASGGGDEYAPDPRYEGTEVRQALFSTKSGRTHRFLYEVVGGEVVVLYVRSASQDLLY